MVKANIYLNFDGRTEEAFKFYKSVFGGDFKSIVRFKDMPGNDKLSASDKEKLMHIALPIGNDMLMATDALESMGWHVNTGDNFSISLNVDSDAEADKIFSKLSKGGKVRSPMKDEAWGDYFGMLTDKFGIQWMVAHSKMM